MKTAAMLLAAILLASCGEDENPAPYPTGGNVVEAQPYDNGQPK